MASTIKLNHAAIGDILKNEMREPTHAAAAAIAANVNVGSVTEAEVIVSDYTTDRAHSVVVIAHPAGLAMEAKRGTLRKAAASVDLTVKSKT